jgi:anti-sigma B factor antagonist
MAVKHLEVGVRREPGGTVLDLRGEINGFAQEALDAAYTEAEKDNRDPILLNFEEVDYINSTGIALIVGLLARARAAKRDLSAYGLSEHYVEIFNITRLSDFVSVFPDERSAMEIADQPASPSTRPEGPTS